MLFLVMFWGHHHDYLSALKLGQLLHIGKRFKIVLNPFQHFNAQFLMGDFTPAKP